MKLLAGLTALLSAIVQVQAKSVFAHFMVGNTEKFGVSDWKNEMALAQSASIDAFVLNMAYGEETNDKSVDNAFSAANELGFKLLFSFDYAGRGPWDKKEVIRMIQTYGSNGAYFKRGSQPVVSTFEGPENANDWPSIKSETGCFFIPDWSSVGARPAAGLANGVVDGLFSWAAWPSGPVDTNTHTDASYFEFLSGKPYMLPISPWFYTNLPGYSKNWLWRGDNLWFDRWQQLIAAEKQPEFVQIISWNDYGESHYIGPLDSRQYGAFEVGKAPYNYVEDMPHDGWRLFLPWFISLWKTGTATTTGNTASQLELEYSPAEIVQDKVFFSALLASGADVSVTVGGTALAASWSTESSDANGVGMYHGSASTNGATGPVVVKISRNGAVVAMFTGKSISTGCKDGYNNYNAWVGSAVASGGIRAVSPALNTDKQVCVRGFGVYEFAKLCKFTCELGYCPMSACTCTQLGPQKKLPDPTGQPGFPKAGLSPSYTGLCSFACNRGYCPTEWCGATEVPLPVPTASPFLAPVCVQGTGSGSLQGLCEYSCNFGFCPRHSCTCTKTGALIEPPAKTSNTVARPVADVLDTGLCSFTCSRGYCPPEACKEDGLPDISDGHVENPFDNYNFVYTVHRNCDASITEGVHNGKNKKDVLTQAIKDAILMSDRSLKWPQVGTEAGKMYMGINDPDNNSNTKYVRANLQNIANMVDKKSSTKVNQEIVYECGDLRNKCETIIQGDVRKVTGHAFNDGLGKEPAHFVTLCPIFFNLPQLAEVINENKGRPKGDLEMQYMTTTALKIIHETLHIDSITNVRGHMRDRKWETSLKKGLNIYGAVDCNLAVTKYKMDSGIISENPDCVAQFVSAMYYRDILGIAPPPSNTPIPEPPAPVRTCLGGDSSRYQYYMTRDNMKKDQEDFCKKAAEKFAENPSANGRFAETYHANTPEEVDFLSVWNSGAELSQEGFQDECNTWMGQIVDECDTNSPAPMNWKHGGDVDARKYNKVRYDIEPKRKRPPPPDKPLGGCNVWYKVLFNEVQLWGAGWANSDSGQDHILPGLRECGLTSDWTFDYDLADDGEEPPKNGIEWSASANIPIGAHMWNCVSQKLGDAGWPDHYCGGR